MAVILHIFRFPSYAGTSPMRITTVHSVHLPFFLKISYQPGHYNVPGRVLKFFDQTAVFAGLFRLKYGIQKSSLKYSNCFPEKNQFLFW